MSNGVTVRARSHTRTHKKQKQKRCLEDIARNTCITVDVLPITQIMQNTLTARMRLHLSIEGATDEYVPELWQLDYIRHELTAYEQVLSELRHVRTTKSVCVQQAYYIWRCRVIRAIGNTYPYLRNACITEITTMPMLELRSLLPNEIHWLTGVSKGIWYSR